MEWGYGGLLVVEWGYGGLLEDEAPELRAER